MKVFEFIGPYITQIMASDGYQNFIKLVDLAKEVNPDFGKESGEPSTAPESPGSDTSGDSGTGDTTGDGSTQE